MRKIYSKMIEKQGFELGVLLEEDRKTWKLSTTLVLSRVRNGKKESVILGSYSKKAIGAKKYMEDLSEINKLNFDKDMKNGKDKEELEQIHSQILRCIERGAEQGGENLSAHQAHHRIIEYVKTHDNPKYWQVQGETCYIDYRRVEEVLANAECIGWTNRLEFVRAMKVNGFVIAGNGRTEKKVSVGKKEQTWALVLKVGGVLDV